MRVLVACEESQVVTEQFILLGHDAISCDLNYEGAKGLPHYKGNVLDIINNGFDLMIAHPPCTYLTNSGVCHLYTNKERWKDLIDGAVFFRKLLNANIPMIAIENPIPHKYAASIIESEYSQIIQPWMFGHTEKKATCLWLKNLPELVPTNNVKTETESLPKNIQQRLHYLPPSKDRAKIRSRTFEGIAKAMAEQWSEYILNKQAA